MSRQIICSDCNEILATPPPKDRLVCPKCGSANLSLKLRFTADPNSVTITLSPNILLQAVIERGPKTSEGDLIIGVAPAWEKILQLLEEDPSLVFKLDPRKWEEIIAGAYEKAGFDEVILTPRSGDFGRDIIAIKKGFWSVRIIDQVKAYAPHHFVPANDVRALLGVLQSDHNATKGLVTTTSDFAPMIANDKFIAPFMPHRLELVNGKELRGRLAAIAKGHAV